MFKVPEQFRAKLPVNHPYYSDASYGDNGAFQFKDNQGVKYNIIASDQDGWNHVSITLFGKKYCPKWEQMCFVKDLFWSDTDTVIQYHPKKSEYRNHHPFCLHLWEKIGYEFPLPRSIMVAPDSNKE